MRKLLHSDLCAHLFAWLRDSKCVCVGGCWCFRICMSYAFRTISIVADILLLHAPVCISARTNQVRFEKLGFKTGMEREHQLVVMVI